MLINLSKCFSAQLHSLMGSTSTLCNEDMVQDKADAIGVRQAVVLSIFLDSVMCKVSKEFIWVWVIVFPQFPHLRDD